MERNYLNSIIIYIFSLMENCRELIDNLTKHQKNCTIDNTTLVELLLAKDAEFRSLLSLADEQAEKDRKMDELKAQVEIQVRTKTVGILILNLIYLMLNVGFVMCFHYRIGKSRNYKIHSKRQRRCWPTPSSRPARSWRAFIRPTSDRFCRRN